MELGSPGSQPRLPGRSMPLTSPTSTLRKSGIDTKVIKGYVSVAPSADSAPRLATDEGTSESPIPAPANRKKSARASLRWNSGVSGSRSPLTVFTAHTSCLAAVNRRRPRRHYTSRPRLGHLPGGHCWLCQVDTSSAKAPSSCPYSPECVEGKFSDVRLYGVRGSSLARGHGTDFRAPRGRGSSVTVSALSRVQLAT